MLTLPTKGIAISVTKHQVQLDILCDWIEGSILFEGESLSTTDVVDFLIEEQIYYDQDFASEHVDNAWSEIEIRQSWLMDAKTLLVKGKRIKPLNEWQNIPGHSFCILLSLATYYSGWSSQFGQDYSEQGELFELLTMASVVSQFNDWEVHQTGWTRSNTVKLKTVVDNMVNILGENPGNLEIWANPDAKEAGLDLLCYRPFNDGRIGIPVYLMQCASGGNWSDKTYTPDLNIWTKVIQFAATPRKAFALPFALSEERFIRVCNLVDGMLLDRYRLLSASTNNRDWLSLDLKNRLVAWLKPRVEALPRAEG